MLSLIHRFNLSPSCSTISISCFQFIIWLFWQTWSVMADLWCSLVEALRVDLVKFLSEIFFCFLSVFCDPGSQLSPCYTGIYLFALAAWNLVHYSSLFFVVSTLSFGWTKTCLRVVWGLTYGALLGSKLIMQTFFKNDFRIATLVARLTANVVSFDIFCENLLLSARSMAYKCFSLPLLSNLNSCYMANCQLSFSSQFSAKTYFFLHGSWLET